MWPIVDIDQLREQERDKKMSQDQSYVTRRGTRLIRMSRRVGSKVYLSRSYYLRCKLKGRPRYFALGRDFPEAARLGDQIHAFLFAGGDFHEALQRFTPAMAAREQRRQISSIGEVLDCYERNHIALDVSQGTAKSYGSRLLTLLTDLMVKRSGEGESVDKEKVRNLPLTILTRKLVTDLKNLRLTGINDQKQLLSAKRTLNSRMREAKALFKPAALDLFRDQGLVVPNLSEFLDSPMFTRTRIEYQLPKPECIQNLVMEARKELPTKNANDYVSFLLAFHAGLRAAEIAAARWDWLGMSDRPYLRVGIESDFHTKSRRGRTIVLEPWVHELLLSYKKEGATYMLSGSQKERSRFSNKRLVDWLRSHGMPEVIKPIHELRKWYGSYIACVFGLTEAQHRLGHSSHQVTCDYYADLEFPTWLSALWEGAKKQSKKNGK